MHGQRDYETTIDGRDVIVSIDIIDYPKFSIESVTEIHPDCERCQGSGEIEAAAGYERRKGRSITDVCPECGGEKEITLTSEQETALYEEISIDLAGSATDAAMDYYEDASHASQ